MTSREKKNARQRAYNKTRGAIVVRRKWQKINRVKLSANSSRSTANARFKCLMHYCAGNPRCMCDGCDVRVIEILELDHNANDGSLYRKLHHRNIYRWLIHSNFPNIITVRCPNCHSARHRNVQCPHNFTPQNATTKKETNKNA